jgi:DNA repair protein RadC
MTTALRPSTPLMLADVPAAERPRERLQHAGAAALSNAELLAILLRTGTAAESVVSLAGRLLATLGGLEGLAKARFEDLTALHGFGEAKAAQLLAAQQALLAPARYGAGLAAMWAVMVLLLVDMSLKPF